MNAFYKGEESTSDSTTITASSGQPVPAKKSKLFGTNTTSSVQSSSTAQCSLSAQLSKYLAIECEYEASFDCFGFSQEHHRTLDKLYFPGIRDLSVPASSSPTECLPVECLLYYLRRRRGLCFRCGLSVCLFVCLSDGLLGNL